MYVLKQLFKTVKKFLISSVNFQIIYARIISSMEGSFFQSNEWQRYYDEEVARMRNFLDDVSRDSGKTVSNHLKSNERTISKPGAESVKGAGDKQKKFLFDDWMSLIDDEKKENKQQSTSKEIILSNKTSNAKILNDKQKLMQKLMKIRGKCKKSFST